MLVFMKGFSENKDIGRVRLAHRQLCVLGARGAPYGLDVFERIIMISRGLTHFCGCLLEPRALRQLEGLVGNALVTLEPQTRVAVFGNQRSLNLGCAGL